MARGLLYVTLRFLATASKLLELSVVTQKSFGKSKSEDKMKN
jgi:hypothetical protein